MLYREIIAVCSKIHTKHINTLCGQNAEFVKVKHCDTYSNHLAVTRGRHSSFSHYVRGLAVIYNTHVHYMEDSKCIVATSVSTYRKHILLNALSYLHAGSLSALPCSLSWKWMLLLTEVWPMAGSAIANQAWYCYVSCGVGVETKVSWSACYSISCCYR